MAHAQSLSQFVKGNHRRVAASALKAAEVLLAEAGTRLNVFLGKPPLSAQASKITTDQLAHIHAL